MFLENKDLPLHSKVLVWAFSFCLVCLGLSLLK